MSDIQLTAVPTPNPNTVKFLVNRQFLEKGSISFLSKQEAENSFLAEKLFEITGIQSLMVGTNFISITKLPNVGWETVLEPATFYLKNVLQSDEPLLNPQLIQEAQTASHHQQTDVINKIIHILDHEIRPAIAMDGGDCQFHSYENGVVTLQLQGACSSCPSATMTLKMGIENRLKEEIPEIQDVVQL